MAATTGYQTRAFEQAAARLGVELVYATDRCHVIEDPWRDRAIPVRFDDEHASADRVVARAREVPFDGVLAVGDRPTVIAALVARRLGLRFHAPAGAATARNKLLMRERLRRAGLRDALVPRARRASRGWRISRFPVSSNRSTSPVAAV